MLIVSSDFLGRGYKYSVIISSTFLLYSSLDDKRYWILARLKIQAVSQFVFLTGNFTDHCAHWIAPVIGASIVTLFFRRGRMNRIYKMESAGVSYHDYPPSPGFENGLVNISWVSN